MTTVAVQHSVSLTDSQGVPQKNAAYTLYRSGTTTVATVYANRNKAPHVGPLITSAAGNATFWVDPGYYEIKLGASAPVPLPYIGEDDSDTLDTSMLGVTVARLDPNTNLVVETQLPNNIRNAYNKPVSGIPESDLTQSIRDKLALAITALQDAPVISVNGQTGAVVIELGTGGNTITLGDATSAAKGIIKLAGDLAGTADQPTVPGLVAKVSTSVFNAALTTLQTAIDSKADSAAMATALGAKVATNDARLSDSRNPNTNSVDNTHIKSGATIDQSKISGLVAALTAKYVLPALGIPLGDLTAAVQASLAKADSAVQLSSGKIATGAIPGPTSRTVTVSGSALANEIVSFDASAASLTATVPTATAGALPVVVRKGDNSSNTVTVVGTGGGTINGETSYIMTEPGETVSLVAAPTGNAYWIY